jgi:hypothetical protein
MAARYREKLKAGMYIEPELFVRNGGEEEPSKTFLLVGRSYTGKSYFIAQQLNLLKGKTRDFGSGKGIRPVYDKIIFFTESLNAKPLENIDPEVEKDIIYVQSGYIPAIGLFLKKINDMTHNHFRFLLIFDDVLTGFKSSLAEKIILLYRNSHISTFLSIQAVKGFLSPALRQNCHYIIITKLAPESMEYMIRSFFKGDVEQMIGYSKSVADLTTRFIDWLGQDMCFFDNKKSELYFIKRDYEI